MATIPQTNVSISAINTENTSTTSNSLKTLSDTATTGTDPADGAPYGMGEFRGYNHIQTHDVVVSFGSPQGKIGFRTGTITSGADVPFGTINLSGFSSSDNNNYVRMTWSGGVNTSWTSVELPDGTTFNRTALTVNGYTHGLFPASNAQYASWGSGTWTFTY
jgi:hypothetical protein